MDIIDAANAKNNASASVTASAAAASAAAATPAAPAVPPRVVGAYPEVKHPSWHNALPAVKESGRTIQARVLEALHARGYGGGPVDSPAWRARPAYIQSFELTSIKDMAAMTRIPLVLLMGGWPGFTAPDTGATHEEMTSPEALAEIARFAAAAGPWKGSLFALARGEGAAEAGGGARDAGKKASPEAAAAEARRSEREQRRADAAGARLRRREGLPPDVAFDMALHDFGSSHGHHGRHHEGSPKIVSTGLVRRMQAAGLQVHPYTLRDEPQFVPAALGGSVARELAALIEGEGADGVFTDFPGTAVEWLAARRRPQGAAVAAAVAAADGAGAGAEMAGGGAAEAALAGVEATAAAAEDGAAAAAGAAPRERRRRRRRAKRRLRRRRRRSLLAAAAAAIAGAEGASRTDL